MNYLTKFIIYIIVWLIDNESLQISATTDKQIFKMPVVEYYNPNQSNGNKISFFYASDFTNSKVNKSKITTFRNTPRILADISNMHEQKTKTEIFNELVINFQALEYQPIVVLVDNNCESLISAQYFTNYLFNNENIKNEFWLMQYNASGVSNVLTQSRTSIKEFRNYINSNIMKYKGMFSNKSTTFFAILKASQILPKNSAILIFAKNYAVDEDLAQLTLNNLIQKQIRLFSIWGDVYPTTGREEKLLEEMSIYSGGSFYSGNFSNTLNCMNIHNIVSNSNKLMTVKEGILIKKKIFNNNKIQIPMDRTIKHLDIIIEGNFHSATLTLPDDSTVNLLDIMSVRRLSPEASTAHERGRWAHVRFNTHHGTSLVGIWEIYVNGPTNNGYNLIIYSETALTISSKLIQNKKSGALYSATNSKEIQLDIEGEISNINNITIVDNNGQELFHIPTNSIKNMKIQDEQNKQIHNLKISTNNITLPNEPFYLQITGATNQGEMFSRISYVEQNRLTKDLPMMFIESSTRTELLATAGSSPKIIFDVTNNFDRAIFVGFSVQDEKSLLHDLRPRSAVIPPKGTVEITVYIAIPASTSLQYTDLITLTAHGEVQAQKSALVYVNQIQTYDTTLPYLHYKYTSNCMEISYSSCQSGVWSIEVTAQDSNTGLLRLVSDPVGLHSPNGYISGTKEPVTAYYSTTCCQPYLEITAVDLNNNKRTYILDAYNATLSTGSIAAIVLGSVLLLTILIVSAVLINKKCKQRNSINLPTYRGQTPSRF